MWRLTSPRFLSTEELDRPPHRMSPSILEPARPELFNFRSAADQKFKEKFER
jgi:hypothetical protein